MTYTVKIIGAGSIGNHYSQAARRAGWDVTVVDVNQAALDRMKNEIYPKRYGVWDEAIKLQLNTVPDSQSYDVVVIGTPPESHVALAREALKNKPRLIHIEKPLCGPTLDNLTELLAEIKAAGTTRVTIGYDHVLAQSVQAALAVVKNGEIGKPLTLDVEFREHWNGIFAAHPWLQGPHDSYLGYTHRGGGASGEHSHALNLWQYWAHELGWGKVTAVSPMYKQVQGEKGEDYDAIATFSLRTSNGDMGRVVQDVVTFPHRKWLRVQGEKGFVEWWCNGAPTGDLVKIHVRDAEPREMVFEKKRPDDFFEVIKHYTAMLNGEVKPDESPVDLERGVETMAVLNAAWNAKTGQEVLVTVPGQAT